MKTRRAHTRTLVVCLLAVLLALAEAGLAEDLTPHVIRFTFSTAGGGSGDCNVTSSVYAATDTSNYTIIGGQNRNVKVRCANASYDSGTQVFQFAATVQNVVSQAVGTIDNVTVDPAGVRLFLYGSAVTGGSGSITLSNADGAAQFTAANQPYFQYNGVLAPYQTSAAKTFQLSVPDTVTSFTLDFLVSTKVAVKLVINEFLANPKGTGPPTGVADANGEWFEVYNAGVFPTNMKNFKIGDVASSGDRPTVVVAASLPVEPGAYLVLGDNANQSTNGGAPVDYSYGAALNLANNLRDIRILSPHHVDGGPEIELERARYRSSAISCKDGISRELKHPSLDNLDGDGSNWADPTAASVYGPFDTRGTPKAQNSTYNASLDPVPNTTIDSSPAHPTASTSATFAFSGTSNVGLAGFEVSLDWGAFTTGTSPQNLTGLSVGWHTFIVRAKDTAGTVDQTPAIYSWLIEVNNPPTITAASGLSRQQGTALNNSTIATVSDADSGAGAVTVTVTSANPSNGVTISNIVNTAGTVAADIVADCPATNAAFTLQASDGTLTTSATLNIGATADALPVLTYSDPAAVNTGGSTTVNPATGPSDNGSIQTVAVQSKGTYTGTISVNGGGVVSISNAAPAGTHTIKIRATDNCGATTDGAFTFIVYTQQQAWRVLHFGSPDNSGAGADSNDYEADGNPNIVEFATGGDPKGFNPRPGVLAMGNNELVFTYQRSKDASSGGFSFAVEFRGDLASGDWSTATVTEMMFDQDAHFEQWKATVPLPAGKGFLHLKVTPP